MPVRTLPGASLQAGLAAVEIIRAIDCRRHRCLADEPQVLAKVETPGVVFAAVARRYDIS
jgi:hypothetical protein